MSPCWCRSKSCTLWPGSRPILQQGWSCRTVPGRGRMHWLGGRCSPGVSPSSPEAALCLAPSAWQTPRSQDQGGGRGEGCQANGIDPETKLRLIQHLKKTLPRYTMENLCSFPEGEPKEKASTSFLRRVVPHEALLHACTVHRKTEGQGGKTGGK